MDPNFMNTVEIYAETDPRQLLAACYVPKATSWRAAQALGRALCAIWRMDAVNAVILDEYGNTVERLIIKANSRK